MSNPIFYLISVLLLISYVQNSSEFNNDIYTNRILSPSPRKVRSFIFAREEEEEEDMGKRARLELPEYSISPEIHSDNDTDSYKSYDDSDEVIGEFRNVPVNHEDLMFPLMDINDENLDPRFLHEALSNYYSLGPIQFIQMRPHDPNTIAPAAAFEYPPIVEIDPKSLVYPKPARNRISGNTATFLLHKDQFSLDAIESIRNLSKIL